MNVRAVPLFGNLAGWTEASGSLHTSVKAFAEWGARRLS